ncbi:MAG: serine/threonine protein kinase [Myxococcales bacterium]|nr:serine/threonine protein kinase [Myxococcales bacterium]
MTDSAESPLAGQLLANKYRLGKRLGAGGMGEVYRATNESIGRAVAIKLLRAELVRHDDVVRRFLREAKAATLVRHPNVVDVLDVHMHDDVPFIVQELLRGEDLADFIATRGGRLTLDEMLAVMIPVADAVGAAHGKGVVHRDLKPHNVFLHVTEEGLVVPKVVDFGISKITNGDPNRVTTTGTALGTPAYMSPEQIEGLAHVDARSDVWSLGVMLFELFAGQRPFIAETAGALFVKIATTEPRSLASVRSEAPAELVTIVERCLQREKDKRFDDARQLSIALKALAQSHKVDLAASLRSLAPRWSLVNAPPGVDQNQIATAESPDAVAATQSAAPSTAPEIIASSVAPAIETARSRGDRGDASSDRRAIGPWALVLALSALSVTGALAYTSRRTTPTVSDRALSSDPTVSNAPVANEVETDAASTGASVTASGEDAQSNVVVATPSVVAQSGADAAAASGPRVRRPTHHATRPTSSGTGATGASGTTASSGSTGTTGTADNGHPRGATTYE